MSIFDVLGKKKEELKKDELKITIMKLIAEQHSDRFLEYDRATDVAILSEVVDGEFSVMETMEDFLSVKDIASYRIYEQDKELYRRKIQGCLSEASYSVFDVRYVVPEFGPKWFRMFLLSIADETGYVTKFVARMKNVQIEKEAEETMLTKAQRDSLSGVYNHATYKHLCTELAEENASGLMFVMVDIDNFKQINDTRGHHRGDQIVQHLGNVLETEVKGRGYAGRIGGDEFSVCMYDVHSKKEAKKLCARIKTAINQFIDASPYTVSMGATISDGRKMTFQELYFEADEAVYFAKENGKNQIIFKDEIQEKKQQKFIESKSHYALSEEEIALDQKLEYIVIVDPVTMQIMYMNKAARNILGFGFDEMQQMHCYDLFKSAKSKCMICELHANHAEVLSDEDASNLKKYIPNGKFILQSTHTIWKGNAARYITFMDVNDASHVERCLESQMESNETFSKCWSLILESNSGDTEYEKVLQVLTDYYESDCSAIVTKDGEEYQEIFEFHHKSGQAVAEGLRACLGQNVLEECEVLLDAEDFMRQSHIDEVIVNYPELAKTLERKFVRNMMGIALRKFGEIIGVLMIINPRHNTMDFNMIGRMGVFFGTELVRKKLSDNKTYE